MKREPKKVDFDRRAVLLGLAGASALMVAKGGGALAQVQEQKGLNVKTIKETESMIQDYRKLRLREATWQPGGSSKITMQNNMVCELSRGSLEEVIDGKKVTWKTGDIWTCKSGQVIESGNKGQTVATMRIFDLLSA